MVNPDPENRPSDLPSSRPSAAWIAIAAVQSVRTFAAAFIALTFSARDRGAVVLAIGAVVIGLGILLLRALQWQRMSFAATDGTVTFDSGVL
jgi:hypothetical protein